MKKRLAIEHLPIYCAQLVISNSPKKIRQYTNGALDLIKSTPVCCTKRDKNTGVFEVIIYLPTHDNGIKTICHESVHAAYHVLHTVGIIHDVDNHEALAYLTDYIAGRCDEFVNGGSK